MPFIHDRSIACDTTAHGHGRGHHHVGPSGVRTRQAMFSSPSLIARLNGSIQRSELGSGTSPQAALLSGRGLIPQTHPVTVEK